MEGKSEEQKPKKRRKIMRDFTLTVPVGKPVDNDGRIVRITPKKGHKNVFRVRLIEYVEEGD